MTSTATTTEFKNQRAKSCWPSAVNAETTQLRGSGHQASATSLADGLLEAAATFDWRLPELFSGHARADVPWPLPYPPSCRPQAWAAAASGALVQAILGLDVDVPAAAVRMTPSRGSGRLPLRVDGLVAGRETFSAGIDAEGAGYVSGLSLALASR